MNNTTITAAKTAKRRWLISKYSEMISNSSDDKIELLFEAAIDTYPEDQRAGYRTVLADHL